jgi:anti-sigma-K factor RskA
MNNDDDLLYELYALGVLEEPERSKVAELLRSGDAEAQRKLANAMETNAFLLGSTPLVEPPKRLRARVLGSVGIVERNWGLMGLFAAAAAAFGVIGIYLGLELQQRDGQLTAARSDLQRTLRQSAETNAELTRARQVLSFLNAPETRVVTFGPKDPKPPKGRILLNPGRGVVLIAGNLPPAPAGRIYQMWILKKGVPAPQPAGLFQTDAAGNAVHFQGGEVPLDAKIAVSLEPESGSPAPTTTPLFAEGL